jgi:hypothetical protein
MGHHPFNKGSFSSTGRSRDMTATFDHGPSDMPAQAAGSTDNRPGASLSLLWVFAVLVPPLLFFMLDSCLALTLHRL